MTNANDFAFNDSATRLLSATKEGIEAHNPPLTKREYFAAMALQGLCVQAIAGAHNMDKVNLNLEKATHAANLADALINALNEKP